MPETPEAQRKRRRTRLEAGVCVAHPDRKTNGHSMCQECIDYHKAYNQKQVREIRAEVISHYSNGKNACECCGESIFEFLTIDHIDNNGAQHRKEIGRGKLLRWLKKQGFPNGYRVLCWNCNSGRGMGPCPHTLKK